MPRIAFVFPGQGSQSVGMGKVWAERYPAARAAFEEADDALGMSLARLCWEGPESDLQLTANTQPAILATSVAILRVIDELGIEPALVAGHSLGEYTALVAAASLDFADALVLVRRRGEFMQEAVPVGVGAMAAFLGLDAESVAAVVEETAQDQIGVVANLNAPDQTVISGHLEAVERAVTLGRERGARRAVMLPVSAPFHSPLMAPAREALTPYLQQAEVKDPVPPVVCNIDAKPVTQGNAARDALIRQVDGPVRWVESVQWMAQEGGIGLLVEVGPGNVLTGLSRRIAPEVERVNLSEPAGLEKLSKTLSEEA